MKLLRSETVAEGTQAFHFAKPAGFELVAGQFCDFTLIDPPETDAEGNTRAFSLACAPGDAELRIATRMRDTAFKRVLGKMAAGGEVEIDGPMGSFTLHRNANKPAVFLAGGIGITPFIGIIRDATQKKLPHQLVLFYSNRRPEDSAFMAELQQLTKENPSFKLVATMAEMEKSQRQWEGERGFIDHEMLKRHLADLNGPIYYIAGPPGMVTAMNKMLMQAAVDPDDVRTEEFGGY